MGSHNWQWRVSKSSHRVILLDDHGDIVMDFVRWGMGGAQPRFNVDGIMRTASELASVREGQEHNASWNMDIDHTTARELSSIPQLRSLLAESVGLLRVYARGYCVEDGGVFGGGGGNCGKCINCRTREFMSRPAIVEIGKGGKDVG